MIENRSSSFYLSQESYEVSIGCWSTLASLLTQGVSSRRALLTSRFVLFFAGRPRLRTSPLLTLSISQELVPCLVLSQIAALDSVIFNNACSPPPRIIFSESTSFSGRCSSNRDRLNTQSQNFWNWSNTSCFSLYQLDEVTTFAAVVGVLGLGYLIVSLESPPRNFLGTTLDAGQSSTLLVTLKNSLILALNYCSIKLGGGVPTREDVLDCTTIKLFCQQR